MRLGLRDHFDLRSVIEQMATQAITAEIGPAVKPGDLTAVQEVKQAEDVLINTVVSGVVDEVFEGQMSAQAVEQLAANAVGTEIGDAMGDEYESSQVQLQPQANTPQAAPQPNIFERIVDDVEVELTLAIDDIKELFDPTLVAPTSQKPAPSIAKKMSRQGIFAQRVNSENDDGINLPLGSSFGNINPALLGKGLALSDTAENSGVSKTPTTSQNLTRSQIYGREFVGGAYGMRDTVVYPFEHPLNTLEGLGRFVTQNKWVFASTIMPGMVPPNLVTSEINADVINFQGAMNNFTAALGGSDPYVSGYAVGSLFGGVAAAVIDPAAVSMTFEGVEVGATNALFTESMDPASALARQSMMMQQNIGYNVTATNTFNTFPMIGKGGNLFITDYRTISNVLGEVEPNQEFNVGLFSYGNQVSFFRATQLALRLGLNNYEELNGGFRVSKIEGINDLAPRTLLTNENNLKYTGVGNGLPMGDPELVINSLSSVSWPWRRT